MELPRKTLEKLKCAECDNYLSCGPVYIKHEDGEAICGRCCKPSDKITQIKQYEAVAEHLNFPCKFAKFGCKEKLKFTMDNSNQHEENCNYRKRSCPIGKTENCSWRGEWGQLVHHCRDKHPEQIFENYCAILHDVVSKEKIINYLLVAFNLLFVLHTKICSTSGKIFYTIRLLGQTENAGNFEYILDIKRDKEHIIKYGKVVSENSLENEENTALILKINTLEEILGDIDDNTIFYVTLTNTQGNLLGGNKIKCKHCKTDFMVNSYEFIPFLDKTGVFLRLCDSCKPKIFFCNNKDKGCTYYDIEAKCKKHEKYFCPFILQCTEDQFTDYCNCLINQGTLFDHLKLNHNTRCLSINTPKYYGRTTERYLLTSIISTVVVESTNSNSLLNSYFKIYTNLKARKLDLYRCEVVMTSPFHKNIEVNTENNKKEDWSFTINGTNHCNIAINIRKD